MKYEIVDRVTAYANGKRHYYTGACCKRGHDCPRYTSNGSCVECTNWSVRGPSASNVKHATFIFPTDKIKMERMGLCTQAIQLLAQDTLCLLVESSEFKAYENAGWTVVQMFQHRVLHRVLLGILAKADGAQWVEDLTSVPAPPTGGPR